MPVISVQRSGAQAHALSGKMIEVRRLDLFLPVTAQLTPAEVIGHDENDVGPGRRGRRPGRLRTTSEDHAAESQPRDYQKFKLIAFHECTSPLCQNQTPNRFF